MKKILVFTKDERSARHYGTPLEKKEGTLVHFCYSANEALILMMQNAFDLIVCDLDPNTMNFRSFLNLNKSGVFPKSVQVLGIINEFDEIPDQNLFSDFIRLPFSDEQLLEKCDALLRHSQKAQA